MAKSTIKKETYYEGATTHYKIAYRGLLDGTPQQIAARELLFLIARSKSAHRNNSLMASAHKKHVQNLGSVKVKWKKKVNSRVKKANVIQKLWDEIADNPSIDNYGDFHSVQTLWNTSMFISGEAISRMVIRKRKGITIPLALQHIDNIYLDPRYNGDYDNIPNLKNGIQFKDGAPYRYFFSKEPESKLILPTSVSSEKIPVDAKEIIHLFIQDMPGQWRGIPIASPIIMPLYALDDLNEATVRKQQAAQAVAWVVENSKPSSLLAIGRNHVVSADGSSTHPVDAIEEKRKVTFSTAGETQYLESGETIQFFQGEGIGNNYDSLVLYETRKIIQSLGLTYQQVTGDINQLSFSSLKFIINEIKARTDFLYNTYIISQGLKPFLNKFLELCQIHGYNVNNVYPCFQYPKSYSIDVLKDVQADLLEISNQLVPKADKLQERGYEYEDIQHDLDIMKEFPDLQQDVTILGQGNSDNSNNSNSNNSNTGTQP